MAQRVAHSAAMAVGRAPVQGPRSYYDGYGVPQLEKQAKLYWMDYLGTLQQVTKGAHGYAGYFVNSVLDQHYREDMTVE